MKARKTRRQQRNAVCMEEKIGMYEKRKNNKMHPVNEQTQSNIIEDLQLERKVILNMVF